MANNWSGYTVYGLWSLDEAATNNRLDNDTYSGNNNDLSESAASVANSATKKEGSASVDIADDGKILLRINANLAPANFPGKSGWSQHDFSVGCWIYPRAVDGTARGIMSVWSANADLRCWMLALNTSNQACFYGSKSGSGAFIANLADALPAANDWYWLCGTYDNDTGAGIPRIGVYVWRASTSSWLGSDTTDFDSTTKMYSLSTTALRIGAYLDATSTVIDFDGLIDEAFVVDGVLTTDEMEDIIAGTLGAETTTAVATTIEPRTITTSELSCYKAINSIIQPTVQTTCNQLATDDIEYLNATLNGQTNVLGNLKNSFALVSSIFPQVFTTCDELITLTIEYLSAALNGQIDISCSLINCSDYTGVRYFKRAYTTSVASDNGVSAEASSNEEILDPASNNWTEFTCAEYANAWENDSDYVEQEATDQLAGMLLQFENDNNTDALFNTSKFQSNIDPDTSPITIFAWNKTSQTWVQKDQRATGDPNTDYTEGHVILEAAASDYWLLDGATYIQTVLIEVEATE